jgi:hypothetical protein
VGTSPRSTTARRYVVPAVGAVVLLTATAPFAGANAGVAIWGCVAWATAWFAMNRVRFSARTVVLTVGAVIALVAALAAVDLLAGGGTTHIGRFFLGLVSDGAGTLELVRRKALNNVGYLSQTPYTWVALAIAAVLAVERWVAPQPLAVALREAPEYRGALLGIVAGSIVALLTEDSGIVMPALMLLAGALPGLYLALEEPSDRPLDPDAT